MTNQTSMPLSNLTAPAAWNGVSRVEDRLSGIVAKRHFSPAQGCFPMTD
jgi:hypothetical protein